MAGDTAGASVQEALFPSPRLRAIPSFSFDYPAGWELEETTQALAAVHPPEPIDGYWLNVIVDHSRIEAAADLQQAAIVTFAQLLHRHPEVRVLTERLAQFDGGRRETYLRVVQLHNGGDDDIELAQIHALFFAPRVPGARTADLFQIIATAPADAVGDHAQLVLGIVKSFRFESGPRT
jgi:hypothetical protein